LNRNIKSQRILAKLCALDSECISKRTTEFIRKYYLTVELLIIICAVTGPEVTFAREQCSAQLLIRETPDFIAPTLWLTNSPDLKPVDYHIWGKLQERVYHSWIHDVT